MPRYQVQLRVDEGNPNYRYISKLGLIGTSGEVKSSHKENIHWEDPEGLDQIHLSCDDNNVPVLEQAFMQKGVIATFTPA